MNTLKIRRNLYIALEEYDFVWDEDDVEEFITLWNKGADIRLIAKYFNRPTIECALLILDLGECGKIKPRLNGVFGGKSHGC
jgi:hypothetical protein